VLPDGLGRALGVPDWRRHRPVDWPTLAVTYAGRVSSVEKDEQTSAATSPQQRRTPAG